MGFARCTHPMQSGPVRKASPLLRSDRFAHPTEAAHFHSTRSPSSSSHRCLCISLSPKFQNPPPPLLGFAFICGTATTAAAAASDPGKAMEINIVDKYEKLEKVGEGTYGKVYKAQDKATGRLVALKKTRLEMDEEGIPPTALREISLLNLLSHSIYVVRLLAVEQAAKNGRPILYLVFEFLDTDLKKYLDVYRRGPNARPLPTHLVKNFLYQLCKGVAHCHGHGVLHRDLKPQNLLVDKEKGILKIADLGLGRAFTVPMKSYTHEIVTLWYRAPEVLLGATHYSTGVDMWSVGCIFAEMVRRQALFPGDSELQQLLHIFRLMGTPSEEQWPGVSGLRDWHEFPQWKPQSLARAVPTLEPEGIDLLSKMLQLDPSSRISAIAAMEHPYFDSLDKSQF